MRQRPFGIAGYWQGLASALRRAPHRALALANVSALRQEAGAWGSFGIFAASPWGFGVTKLRRDDRLSTISDMHVLDLLAAGADKKQPRASSLAIDTAQLGPCHPRRWRG